MRTSLTFALALFLVALSGQTSAQQLLPGEREATVTAISGVIAAGAKWELVWADFETADGINGTRGRWCAVRAGTDRHRAQARCNGQGVHPRERYARRRLCVTRRPGTAVRRAAGLHRHRQAVQRRCQELPSISMLSPERRLLANSFKDGKPLGRVNDVMADGKGGAYFTSGGAFHVTADGVVSTVEDKNLRSNGIMLSPDGKTLYVTNDTS